MLRFDGLYQSQPVEYAPGIPVRHYVRFFPDGVLTFDVSQEEAAKVAPLLTRERGVAPYTLEGDVVRWYLEVGDRSDEAWFKTIDYEGRMEGDVLRVLSIARLPLINDYGPTDQHSTFDFTFVPSE